LFGLRIRKWRKQNSIYQAEDGGIRAHAESQRERRDDGEAGRLSHHAQTVANILQYLFHKNYS
jgi:hypothetical protein